MKKRIAFLIFLMLSACAREKTEPQAEEPEMLSRTEFTDRLENFFEYAPLKQNQPSRFLIHLTDLSDGTPVEQAEVTLIARSKSGSTGPVEVTAKVGRVIGIYVAELTPVAPGDHDLEFHIKNSKLEQRMPLSGFRVQ